MSDYYETYMQSVVLDPLTTSGYEYIYFQTIIKMQG